MKRMLFLLLICSLSISVFAQHQEYKDKGDKAFNSGNYSEAVTQYKAALALMQKNKIAKSDQLLMEKRQTQAEECLKFRSDADNIFSGARTQANYTSAKVTYQKILQYNKSDKYAAQQIKTCDNKIAQIVRAAEDDKLWNKMLSFNTIENFQEYLSSYPDGLHAADARAKIKSLETQQLKLADDRLWNIALKQNTEEAYSNYINNSKTGNYVVDAKKKISELWDDELWKLASGFATIESYDGYLNNEENKNKRYVKQANAEIYMIRAKQDYESGNFQQALDYMKKAQSLVQLNESQQIFFNRCVNANLSKNKKATMAENKGSSTKSSSLSQIYSTSYPRSSGWDERVLLGLGIEGELWGYTSAYGPLVHLKLGKYDDVFNLSVGAQYSIYEALDRENYVCAVSFNQISVPVNLRFNMGHSKIFLAFGGSYNYNFGAKYLDKFDNVKVEDKSLLINKTNFSGTCHLGIGGEIYDFSVYCKYDITSPYNEDYINTINESDYVKNQLSEKYRIGASLKIYIKL